MRSEEEIFLLARLCKMHFKLHTPSYRRRIMPTRPQRPIVTGLSREVVAESVGKPNRSVNEVFYGGYMYVEDEWRQIPTDAAPFVTTVLDLDHPKPVRSEIRQAESRARARKLRRKPLIRVTSTLGLIPVRLSLVSINDFPKNDMRICSQISELVYHSPEALQLDSRLSALIPRMARNFPLTIEGTEPTDPQATMWLFRDDGSLFIAFRGDHDMDKLCFNLGLSPHSVAESHKPVHSGLANDFKQIERYIRPIIEKYSRDIHRIVLTGHGLGGALATVGAPFIAELIRDKPVDCYTFGAPVIGSDDFTEWFKSTVRQAVRVIDSSDPVPFLPARTRLGHPIDSLCITRSGYTERWSAKIQPTVQVLTGIDKIDFDEWRWQQSAQKYSRRVSAAVTRGNMGQGFKHYDTSAIGETARKTRGA